MNPVDRVARACVTAAARRWPAELSQTMSLEWCAELDAVRDDPTTGPVTRAWRAAAFAGSIALSPPVEAAGTEPVTWRDRAGGAGRALTALSGVAAVTLLAAALFNATHLGYHRARPHLPPVGDALVDAGLLTVAAGLMAWAAAVAARRCPLPARRPATAVVRLTVASGAATYAFLLAGNRVAVMPFMGWMDIAPAVVAWVVLTGMSAAAATRYAAAGRRRLGLAVGTAGTLVALEVATAGGSLHAAATLGVGVTSAPAWFPLTLLPGGTVDFGPVLTGGAMMPGGPGPALRASDVLLGNAAAMIGPLLLCSAFVIGYAVRAVHRDTVTDQTPVAAAPAGWQRRILLGTLAGLAGLAGCEVVSRAGAGGAATPATLLDNATVFGFGFATHAAGRAAVTLLVAVAVVRYATDPRTERATPM